MELEYAAHAWGAFLTRALDAELGVRPDGLYVQIWERPKSARCVGLAPGVVDALCYLTENWTPSQIGALLNISESTVNRRLGVGFAVLGTSRMSLPILRRILTSIPCRPIPSVLQIALRPVRSWSEAELACVLGALSGASVEDLARERSRRPTTVRKQLLHAAHKQGYMDMQTLSCRIDFVIREANVLARDLTGDGFFPLQKDPNPPRDLQAP